MIGIKKEFGLVVKATDGVKVIGGQLSQVRYRRTLAYPFYSKVGNIPPARHSRKQTVFKRLMDEFLGPKNYKGEYYLNKYAYPNQDHTTNYVDPETERGNSLLSTKGHSSRSAEQSSSSEGAKDGEEDTESNLLGSGGNGKVRNSLQPFPMNTHCHTNTQVSKEMKQQIINDVVNLSLTPQSVALKYGLKIQRIEAIVKLHEIEERFKSEGKITKDMQKFADVMYNLFPLYDPKKNAENLTEIPIPEATKQSRFLTIAESEPFGPIDAAQEYGLEPAAVTLQRLSHGSEPSSNDVKKEQKKDSRSFIAPMNKGDRSAFRFTNVKVGKVGYRYGKSFRDNRKDRKIDFDAAGKMYYPIE